MLVQGCRQRSENIRLSSVPEWAKEAIWYQIFVERFRNGDPSNDPTPADMYGSYPGYIPRNWTITPWGHDWYARESWFDSMKVNGFYQRIQARRYGGDFREFSINLIIYMHWEPMQFILIRLTTLLHCINMMREIMLILTVISDLIRKGMWKL